MPYKDVGMKKLIVFACALFLIIPPVFADSIKCYSNGKLIYSHQVRDVTFTGDLFVFTELGSDKIIVFSGECIAKIAT